MVDDFFQTLCSRFNATQILAILRVLPSSTSPASKPQTPPSKRWTASTSATERSPSRTPSKRTRRASVTDRLPNDSLRPRILSPMPTSPISCLPTLRQCPFRISRVCHSRHLHRQAWFHHHRPLFRYLLTRWTWCNLCHPRHAHRCHQASTRPCHQDHHRGQVGCLLLLPLQDGCLPHHPALTVILRCLLWDGPGQAGAPCVPQWCDLRCPQARRRHKMSHFLTFFFAKLWNISF